jgi:hypothetical protein
LALLVERELFEFDREGFSLLARDVGAELIVAEGSARKEQVAAALLRELETAVDRWRPATVSFALLREYRAASWPFSGKRFGRCSTSSWRQREAHVNVLPSPSADVTWIFY